MKKFFSTIICVCALAVWASGAAEDQVRQAFQGALDQAESSLKQAPFGKKTVAVLPFADDPSGILTGHLKSILTRCNFTCVEGKEDQQWAELAKEIAWQERKDDILDPETIVKFGKQKGAQILVYGKLREADHNAERTYVEIELHATDLTTQQHIWGGNFAFRLYAGKEVQGIVALDGNLRAFLKESFAEVSNSLLAPENVSKLDRIKSVAVIPLAGDVDQCLTELVVENFSQSTHLPKNPQIPSLATVRMLSKNGQLGCDGILYGSLRDLRISAPRERRDGQKVFTERTISVDYRLFLEDAKTGAILWSKTVILSKVISEERALSAAEKQQLRQEKIAAVPEEIKEDLVTNWRKYAVIFGYTVGGIVLLILIIFGIKMFISYHNVR